MNNKEEKISVIGLGKLGASLTAVIADNGFSVIGYDIDSDKVKAIKKGKHPVQETNLGRYIQKNKHYIQATNDIAELIKKTGITFIVVPTPSKKDRSFSTKYIENVGKAVGPALSQKKQYHLFVLVSTVLPGNSRKKIIPALEKYSEEKCGDGFGYCYSPSLIALGNVISNLESPDFLFLGAFDKQSATKLKQFYTALYNNKVPIYQSSIESAEIGKISLNSYITMKITFANILGEMCEHIPYSNVDDITDMLGADKRIGNLYLRSGLGYGGTCFPRDNKAFAYTSNIYEGETKLATTTHKLNKKIPSKMYSFIKRYLKISSNKIAVLGLSYKPDTPIIEKSQSMEIINLIVKNKNIKSITVYDPQGYSDVVESVNEKVNFVDNFKDIVGNNVIFIANPDKKFKTLPQILSEQNNQNVTIIDPWGMFTQQQFSDLIEYIPIGRKYKFKKIK